MYTTPEALNNEFGEEQVLAWADHKPEKITTAVENATNEIKGYLASGGYVPPAEAPPLLATHAASLAAYYLLSGGRVNKDDWENTLLDRAKEARKYLEKVGEGKLKVPDLQRSSEKATPATGAGGPIAIRTGRKLDLSRRWD